ncbi:hypothetical protein [Chromobacterium violaceum]|uniref:hypothetical protein n=1 Tax=Chromobacterium violaceum TaxID=536 RepID=UPI001CE192D6|nr:hypothetical protein [Chromobacterium violaceum]
MNRYGYKKKPSHLGIGPTISATRKAFDLYLRFKPVRWNNTLVIARIEFDKTRTGNGTSLLEVLTMLSEKYHYDSIGIEAALTEEIVSFVKKFGFSKVPNKNDDWLIPITTLKQNLEQCKSSKPHSF